MISLIDTMDVVIRKTIINQGVVAFYIYNWQDPVATVSNGHFENLAPSEHPEDIASLVDSMQLQFIQTANKLIQ